MGGFGESGKSRECGIEAIGTTEIKTNIRFYVFALLFVIFDVETVFVFPWAVTVREIGPVALVEMEAEIGNISAAWTWAVERGHVEQLGSAMEGLEHFYWQSGRYREAKAALQAAAKAAESAAHRADHKAACLRVWVRALAWQSSVQRATGQSDAAQQLHQQCLAILQDPALAGSDTRLERAILSWSMGATVCMADYAQGRQHIEESYSQEGDTATYNLGTGSGSWGTRRGWTMTARLWRCDPNPGGR